MARKELALPAPEEWLPQVETDPEWWDQWYKLPVTQAVLSGLQRRLLKELELTQPKEPHEAMAHAWLAEGLKQALKEIEMAEQKAKAK